MRVKIATNPPLPPLKAWFSLASVHNQTISSFKTHLSIALPCFNGFSPASLHLSIDGFELLDTSELGIVKDGDLISVDVRVVPPQHAIPRDLHPGQGQIVDQSEMRLGPGSLKRKRCTSMQSSSDSESDEPDTESTTTTTSGSGSESESETSDTGGASSDEASLLALQTISTPQARVQAQERLQATPVQPMARPLTFIPPGHGKPQTRARNRRRRLKRMYECEAATVPEGGPVSGANAVVPDDDACADIDGDTHAASPLMSLSLRNKNKARNFKSLLNKPLPPKIIFEDKVATLAKVQTQVLPRLVPPSSRSSLPPNLFVTSVDVEADLQRRKKQREDGDGLEADVTLDYGEVTDSGLEELKTTMNERWATLEKPTCGKQIAVETLVGFKAFGIDPVTCTPGHVFTVGRVVSCGCDGLVVRPLRAASFAGQAEIGPEGHAWEEIEGGDWRLLG